MLPTIEVPMAVALAIVPFFGVVGAFLYRTWFGFNPIQKRRDQMLNESLDLAEKKILRLQASLNDLEETVRILRGDLQWEREENRKLRKIAAHIHERHPELEE
jgi:hypothetical protein